MDEAANDTKTEEITNATKTKKQSSASMTVAELKDMCRERGLRVTGNKNELLERLSSGVNDNNNDASTSQPAAKKAKTNTTTKYTAGNIGKRLEDAGCQWESHCAAKAIVKGYLRWTGTKEEFDQPAMVMMKGHTDFTPLLASDPAGECKHKWTPTLRQLLSQPDYAGLDYEDGLENATVFCGECKDKEESEGRCYVTRMCQGDFSSNCGKVSTENNLFVFLFKYYYQ